LKGRTKKSIKITDLGWERINAELKIAEKSYTVVGFPQRGEIGAAGAGSREPSADFSELVRVAVVHEFGAPKRRIPERPFMRTAFDENLSDLNEVKKREYQNIIDGKTTAKQGLERLGELHKSHIQKKITDITSPPLRPLTVRRKKGSTKPLIDTGQLRASVQHKEVIK
jgi:hypothetical protein